MIRNKVITDAGRVTSGFAGEEKDCTVRALSKAGNMSYEQAHKIMAEEGRITGRGGSVLSGIRGNKQWTDSGTAHSGSEHQAIRRAASTRPLHLTN